LSVSFPPITGPIMEPSEYDAMSRPAALPIRIGSVAFHYLFSYLLIYF
jgi:hypothetical protein